MTAGTELSALLANARAVLFDFDGPLCDVFAGMPAAGVARQLEEILGERVDTDDPLEVLRESVRFGPDIVRAVEDALITAEVAAVGCSERTPGGVEAIRACLAMGKSVAVVSNNSRDSVTAFLEISELGAVIPVVGRPYVDPGRMKPHPWPILAALQMLDAANDDVVFIGDSFTDFEASKLAGVQWVAYANKSWKLEAFRGAGVLVVQDMEEVGEAIH